ncbi:hydroxyproline-rich glycoprotein-like [Panicum miliaceum]|uniref:Hydroxyproline-rich glycoprotein-like n=1 Tax=Panicum miliaceum TaxID=4540 RepID=A0A3L6T8I4_PANMI|nr:hydroxyproline-rich glycoprotein-like [Panicum miliaceum]
MEEAGRENPWRQFLGRSSPYLRARADPTPSTGEIILSIDNSKRLADRVIELKDQEIGVREHDILSTAFDMLEHRGRVRGVSSLKGWKEGLITGSFSTMLIEIGQGVVLPEEKKNGILIPPIGRSSSTGGAQKRTRTPTPSPLSPMVQTPPPPSQKIYQATKDQTPKLVTVVASGSPAKKKVRTTPKTAATKKGRGKVAAAKKATKAKGNEAPKEPANTWTLAHPKFVMGKPMLTMEELASVGVNTRGLHKHYISHAMHKEDPSIVGEFKARDLHSGPGYFPVAWQLNKESRERQLGVAFIDPQHCSATVNAKDPDHRMQQGSGNECGFYVAYHMIRLTSTFKNFKGAKDMQDDKDKLEKQQLLAIREKVAQFLVVDVNKTKSLFYVFNLRDQDGCQILVVLQDVAGSTK